MKKPREFLFASLVDYSILDSLLFDAVVWHSSNDPVERGENYAVTEYLKAGGHFLRNT